MLVDGDRIRNLLGVYCDLIDAGDFEGVGRLFAEGRLADEHGTELARVAESVARFFRSTVKLHDGSPRTKHLVLNTVLDEPAPDGTVTARSSYLVLQAVTDGDLRPLVTGRYVDTFACDGAGTWHFVERRFVVDLTGDLSEHLSFDLG